MKRVFKVICNNRTFLDLFEWALNFSIKYVKCDEEIFIKNMTALTEVLILDEETNAQCLT